MKNCIRIQNVGALITRASSSCAILPAGFLVRSEIPEGEDHATWHTYVYLIPVGLNANQTFSSCRINSSTPINPIKNKPTTLIWFLIKL